jgi:hypothetical protein
VLQLEVIYRILDELRREAIEAVESPKKGEKNAFGFGRVAGMLYEIAALRERIDQQVEEADEQNELRG